MITVVGKLSRNPDVDPILLEHETKKLDLAMESKRNQSARPRMSQSPARRQPRPLSPTRQPPTRPTQASLNKQVTRRSSPSPVPLRSSMRR